MTTRTDLNPNLAAALLYAALGWPVVPLHTPRDTVCDCPKHADCQSPGKHPRTMHGLDDATTDGDRIRRWWTIWPAANIAIDLARSRLVDIAPDSLEWFAEFTARGLPRTLRFASGGGQGHAHYLYARPEGCAVYRLTRTGEYDVLSAGYAVMPPSLHASGRLYTWLEPESGLVINQPHEQAPAWSVTLLSARQRPAAEPTYDTDAPPVELPSEGFERWHGRLFDAKPNGSVDRSHSLWRLATVLLDAGCTQSFVEQLLAERDSALGWTKFHGRRDAATRYRVIVARAVAGRGPRVRPPKTKQRAASKEPKESPGFVFTALEDLLAEPPEEVAYLVDGLLPTGGVSLWGAKPKVGKSVAVRNLAIAVARGETFLERACHRGTVLLLALEEKRAEVANHFRILGGTDELIHVHVGAAPATSKEGLAVLANAVALYQPVLVIADPVLKLIRVRDSSDYAELTRELEPIIELARASGCHIAVAHHLGKMLREGGDDVLGSTAIFGAVDTLVLVRRRKDNQRVLQSIQRYGVDLPETLIPMDAETGRIGLGVELSEVRVQEAREAVLDLLGKLETGERLDQKAVREQAGVQSALAYRALQDLTNEGVVDRSGSGKRGDAFQYCLTEKLQEKGCSLDLPIYIGEQETKKNSNPDGSAEELPW